MLRLQTGTLVKRRQLTSYKPVRLNRRRYCVREPINPSTHHDVHHPKKPIVPAQGAVFDTKSNSSLLDDMIDDAADLGPDPSNVNSYGTIHTSQNTHKKPSAMHKEIREATEKFNFKAAVRLYTNYSQRPSFEMNLQTLNFVLKAMAGAKVSTLPPNLINSLIELKPEDPTPWNRALAVYARNANHSGFAHIVSYMIRSAKFTVQTYGTMMTLHINSGNPDKAMETYHEMLHNNLTPNTSTFSVLCNCNFNFWSAPQVRYIASEVERVKPHMDGNLCVSLIGLFSNISDVTKMDYYKNVLIYNCNPTMRQYANTLRSYAKLGNEYHSATSGLVKHIMEHCYIDKDEPQNKILETILLRYFADQKDVMHVHMFAAKLLASEMDSKALATLIFAYCRIGDPKKAIELYQTHADMPMIPMDQEVILNAFSEHGQLGIVMNIFNKMRANSAKLTPKVSQSILKTLLKREQFTEAMEMVNEITKSGTADFKLLCCLQDGLFKKGMYQETLKVSETIEKYFVFDRQSMRAYYLTVVQLQDTERAARLAAEAAEKGWQFTKDFNSKLYTDSVPRKNKHKGRRVREYYDRLSANPEVETLTPEEDKEASFLKPSPNYSPLNPLARFD